MQKVTTIHNGVNVDDLMATVTRASENRALCKFKYRSHAHWINRSHSHSTFESMYGMGEEHHRATPLFMEGDEPAVLLGTDMAPNAAEAILHGLSSCLSVTYAYTAAAMGIDISTLSFELEADNDLQGFLELDPKVRPGLSEIRVKVNLVCNGTPEQVKELHAKAQRLSPILDTLKNPVNIKVKV